MQWVIVNGRDLPLALRKHFEQAQDQLREAALAVCHRGAEEARRIVESEDIIDREVYLRNMRVTLAATGDPALANNAPHAIYVEHGRRPGAKMPPHEPIAGWAERKLGVTDPGRVYAIRRAIAQRGIRPKLVFRRVTTKMREWFRSEANVRLARPFPTR